MALLKEQIERACLSKYGYKCVTVLLYLSYLCCGMAEASQSVSFKAHPPLDNKVCTVALGPEPDGLNTRGSCAAMCASTSECEGFTYRKHGNICRGCTKDVYNMSISLDDLAGATTYLSSCPRDHFTGSCYHLDTRLQRFTEAKAYCEGLAVGGHLIYIETRAEKEYIIGMLGAKYPSGVGARKVWIGGHDQNTNVFRWLNGYLVNYTGFSDWNGEEPSSSRNENYLAAIAENGYSWSDDKDSSKYPSLCEMPSL